MTPDAVDQIPDCSRSSVLRMPARRSVGTASSPRRAPRVSSAGTPSWRSTQWSTLRIETPSSDAACSNGASSAAARSVQWASAPVPTAPETLPRAVRTMASATSIAPRHSFAALTGDQPTRCTPRGRSTAPVGSKARHHPDAARAAAVERSTSGFVDVATTAPGADKTLGTTSADVLPERDGPRTSVDRSAPAHAHPVAPRPRYNPRPARAASRTSAMGSAIVPRKPCADATGLMSVRNGRGTARSPKFFRSRHRRPGGAFASTSPTYPCTT